MGDASESDDLKKVVREVIKEEIQSDDFQKALENALEKIIVMHVGRSVLHKLKWFVALFLLAFSFWLGQNGFIEWLKTKGLFNG